MKILKKYSKSKNQNLNLKTKNQKPKAENQKPKSKNQKLKSKNQKLKLKTTETIITLVVVARSIFFREYYHPPCTS